LSLEFQVIYAARSCCVISPRSLHDDVSYRCLVAGHAHCTSMASRTTYSTWTPQKPTLFDGHYLRNRSTLDIGVLGYIGIVQHKEHSPEVLSIPPGTPCIYIIKYFLNLKCWIRTKGKYIFRYILRPGMGIAIYIHILLLLLALQPTVGFSLLSDFLPFRPFLTQFSPPSYSHYQYIFFDVLNFSYLLVSTLLPYPYPCFVIYVVFVTAVRFPSLNSSQHFSFNGAELSTLCPTPNLEDQGISLSRVSLLETVWLGWPYQKLKFPPA